MPSPPRLFSPHPPKAPIRTNPSSSSRRSDLSPSKPANVDRMEGIDNFGRGKGSQAPSVPTYRERSVDAARTKFIKEEPDSDNELPNSSKKNEIQIHHKNDYELDHDKIFPIRGNGLRPISILRQKTPDIEKKLKKALTQNPNMTEKDKADFREAEHRKCSDDWELRRTEIPPATEACIADDEPNLADKDKKRSGRLQPDVKRALEADARQTIECMMRGESPPYLDYLSVRPADPAKLLPHERLLGEDEVHIDDAKARYLSDWKLGPPYAGKHITTEVQASQEAEDYGDARAHGSALQLTDGTILSAIGSGNIAPKINTTYNLIKNENGLPTIIHGHTGADYYDVINHFRRKNKKGEFSLWGSFLGIHKPNPDDPHRQWGILRARYDKNGKIPAHIKALYVPINAFEEEPVVKVEHVEQPIDSDSEDKVKVKPESIDEDIDLPMVARDNFSPDFVGLGRSNLPWREESLPSDLIRVGQSAHTPVPSLSLSALELRSNPSSRVLGKRCGGAGSEVSSSVQAKYSLKEKTLRMLQAALKGKLNPDEHATDIERVVLFREKLDDDDRSSITSNDVEPIKGIVEEEDYKIKKRDKDELSSLLNQLKSSKGKQESLEPVTSGEIATDSPNKRRRLQQEMTRGEDLKQDTAEQNPNKLKRFQPPELKPEDEVAKLETQYDALLMSARTHETEVGVVNKQLELLSWDSKKRYPNHYFESTIYPLLKRKTFALDQKRKMHDQAQVLKAQIIALKDGDVSEAFAGSSNAPTLEDLEAKLNKLRHHFRQKNGVQKEAKGNLTAKIRSLRCPSNDQRLQPFHDEVHKANRVLEDIKKQQAVVEAEIKALKKALGIYPSGDEEELRYSSQRREGRDYQGGYDSRSGRRLSPFDSRREAAPRFDRRGGDDHDSPTRFDNQNKDRNFTSFLSRKDSSSSVPFNAPTGPKLMTNPPPTFRERGEPTYYNARQQRADELSFPPAPMHDRALLRDYNRDRDKALKAADNRFRDPERYPELLTRLREKYGERDSVMPESRSAEGDKEREIFVIERSEKHS